MTQGHQLGTDTRDIPLPCLRWPQQMAKPSIWRWGHDRTSRLFFMTTAARALLFLDVFGVHCCSIKLPWPPLAVWKNGFRWCHSWFARKAGQDWGLLAWPGTWTYRGGNVALRIVATNQTCSDIPPHLTFPKHYEEVRKHWRLYLTWEK